MDLKPFNMKKADQPASQEGNRKQLHGEIRKMTSAINHHLNSLHHIGTSSSSHHDETEKQGPGGVITLAGTNTGATMQGEMDDTSETQDAFTTYTNSNFQAINNSIMIGGSYTCKDPGVHIEACMDDVQQSHGKNGKKKVRGTSRTDQHPDGASDDENSE